MAEERPNHPGSELTREDLAALRQHYTARGVVELFQALRLPVCDDASAIAGVIEREQQQREQESFGSDPTQRQEAAAWLSATRLIGPQPSRRELLLLVQEETNRMLGFRLERYGQAGKPYTPEIRADLKAAAIRGFALGDDLAERFLRAFEHGCELRFGVKVPLVLHSFDAREVAEETFSAPMTILLPPMPPADVPDSSKASAPARQPTAPMPAIRPGQSITKISAPAERKPSAPILPPDKAQAKLVLTQSEQTGEWLLTRDTVSIGRVAESDLCLKDDLRVSRQHAVIHRAPTAYILTDLNSANGTFLNGALLTEPAVLHPGDVIRVGHTELTFIMEPLANPQNA
ncbi:MAG TPA: FHA domain-containing protein [Ktedonobacterales bacterium]|nr:FHA domain-containing protein [Ktedonobacterales bacterium]